MPDNGYAFSIPTGRGMSNNRQTRQGVGFRAAATSRQQLLTRQSGGTVGRMVEVVDGVASAKPPLSLTPAARIGMSRSSVAAAALTGKGSRTYGE